MPELPEVETVKRTLSPFLVGKTIESFDLRWYRTLQTPDLPTLVDAIVGHTIISVDRRGKLIVIRLDDGGAITVHLRMTGELLFVPNVTAALNDSRERYIRAVFTFSDSSILIFYDTRKFGKIAWHPLDSMITVDQRIGLEPLDDTFTADAFYRALSNRQRQLKALLLDQTVVAGLGNIYVDEALFQARLHPLSVSSSLSRGQADVLHAAIVSLLRRAVESRGTTLRDYRSGLGAQGDYQHSLRIYGSKPGSPCPDCGTPLERIVVGQRGSIFCPNCQVRVTPDTLRQS